MDYPGLIVTGRLVATSHVLLLTLLLGIRLRGWDRIYAVMIGAGSAGYLMLPLLLEIDVPPALRLLAFVLQIGLSFWLWTYALAVRDPNFRPGWPHAAVLVAKIVITIGWAITQHQPEFALVKLSTAELDIWRMLVPALLTLALTAAAVYAAGHRLGDELNQQALGLRRLLVYSGAAAMLLMALVYIALRGERLEQIAAWLIVGLAMAICVRVHLMLLQSGPTPVASQPAEQPANAPVSEKDRALAERIERCMRDEEFFRNEGLTVGMLAGHLSELDYRVRRTINTVLGYRNFNVYINEIRVGAAKQTLLADSELPVIRLAMDLGYRSLAGFNKAFKDNTGQTPTEFRRQAAVSETAVKNAD